jgi:sedoheptulose-bisphosphatase
LVPPPCRRAAPAGKVFAPGNLRATSDNAQYKALFNYWVGERYTLRYTG